MDSLSSFLHMGGYAGFVWPSFAITLLVMTVLLVASLRSLKAQESALAALQGGARKTERREAPGEA